MTSELKPCPLCGGAVDPEGWISCNRKGPECEECGATANSVMEWNTRAVPDAPELARFLQNAITSLLENDGAKGSKRYNPAIYFAAREQCFIALAQLRKENADDK